MKTLKLIFSGLLLCAILSPIAIAQELQPCGTAEHQQMLQEKFPNEYQSETEFEKRMAIAIQNLKHHKDHKSGAPYYNIPIVFHILTDGGDTNLDASLIYSQLESLNKDFQKLNANLNNSYQYHIPFAADCKINFCLATKDENGNCLAETGIMRHTQYCDFLEGFECYPTTEVRQQTIQDPERYLNVWIGTLVLNAGVAIFPVMSGLSGLDGVVVSNPNPATDGIILDYKVVGSPSNPNPYNPGGTRGYNKGKILTHEIGHYLGLRHIWGDSSCGNDYCDDTPKQSSAFSGCPTDSRTCDNLKDMNNNYMDYTSDDCSSIFTYGQRARMFAVLQNSPRRPSFSQIPGICETCVTNCGCPGCNDRSLVDQTLAGNFSAFVSNEIDYHFTDLIKSYLTNYAEIHEIVKSNPAIKESLDKLINEIKPWLIQGITYNANKKLANTEFEMILDFADQFKSLIKSESLANDFDKHYKRFSKIENKSAKEAILAFDRDIISADDFQHFLSNNTGNGIQNQLEEIQVLNSDVELRYQLFNLNGQLIEGNMDAQDFKISNLSLNLENGLYIIAVLNKTNNSLIASIKYPIYR